MLSKIFTVMAFLLMPSIANAFPKSQCTHAVKEHLYKQSYTSPSNTSFYPFGNAPQYYFKWNSEDQWTPCKHDTDNSMLYCGTVAKLYAPNTTFSNDVVDILSTSGEKFRSFQKGAKLMKCSVKNNPKTGVKSGEEGFIFSYDFSAIYLFEFTARGTGKRTFFLKEDILDEETPALLGAPKF
jgi:hypothetical protein